MLHRKLKKKSPNIIGISGKMGSGKNTVASIIQYLTAKEPFQFTIEEFLSTHSDFQNNKNCSWKQVSFAFKLKQIVSMLSGIPVKDLDKQEIKDMTFKELYEKGYISKSFYDSLDDY